MVITYKQKCSKCRTNYVIVTWKDKFPVCYACQKKELSGTISDPIMAKMFDIPESFYEQNSFLRSIKINYLKYGKLTDKQIEAFKKAVEKLRQKSSEANSSQ